MVTVSVCSVATSWGCMDSSWSFRLELESLEAELVDMDNGVLELDVAFPCELPWPPVTHMNFVLAGVLVRCVTSMRGTGGQGSELTDIY
ncbi:hypothetical protein HU200_065880 [Digitaria exilis]|uniref:Uncharacterized protein n=1 Tax=Digitaria exilis TaxID=1010633 RepID=A0A834ZZ95_9POAL|nr:hypothetical protein HU200_065880 [Digitaria exilis]